MLSVIGQRLQDNLNERPVVWQKVEATLFAVRSIGRAVESDRNSETINMVAQILESLPEKS